MKILPSQKIIKTYFHYDPLTGIFSRIKSSGARSKLGPITKKTKGYLIARFENKSYYVHRLIFMYMINECPNLVDHANGNKLDNRWMNLRGATASQNQGNARKSKTNTSGYKGVSYDKIAKKWRANIGFPKKFLGYFDTPEAAFRAYESAARKKYGKFARME